MKPETSIIPDGAKNAFATEKMEFSHFTSSIGLLFFCTPRIDKEHHFSLTPTRISELDQQTKKNLEKYSDGAEKCLLNRKNRFLHFYELHRNIIYFAPPGSIKNIIFHLHLRGLVIWTCGKNKNTIGMAKTFGYIKNRVPKVDFRGGVNR